MVPEVSVHAQLAPKQKHHGVREWHWKAILLTTSRKQRIGEESESKVQEFRYHPHGHPHPAMTHPDALEMCFTDLLRISQATKLTVWCNIWVWWHLLVILALWEAEKENLKLEISLGHLAT